MVIERGNLKTLEATFAYKRVPNLTEFQRLHSHIPFTMGLNTLQAMPFAKLPSAFSTLSSSSSSRSPLLVNPSLPLRQTPITTTAALSPRSICLRSVVPRATTSEETSSGSSPFFDEKRDGTVVVEDVKPDDNNPLSETDEDREKEMPVEEEQGFSLDFLDKLNIKFNADDTSSVVVYGGGALVALWLSSAIIGAIDSIPLFPKLLEVVGLGYTIWFSTRYLLFKTNRDELVAKIEELKEQVLGSEDK